PQPGEIPAEFPTQLTPEALTQFEDRERIAAVAAMHHLLAPKSLAVIGASHQRGTIGAELFHNIIAMGFQGSVFAVNPRASAIESYPAYASVLDIKEDVELAVIAVPAKAVLDV